jgi:hypothetical protein
VAYGGGPKLSALSRAHLTVLNGAFGEVIAFCHDPTSSSQNAIYILYRKSKNLPFGLGPWAWVLGPSAALLPPGSRSHLQVHCLELHTGAGGTKRTVFPQALIADNL